MVSKRVLHKGTAKSKKSEIKPPSGGATDRRLASPPARKPVPTRRSTATNRQGATRQPATFAVVDKRQRAATNSAAKKTPEKASTAKLIQATMETLNRTLATGATIRENLKVDLEQACGNFEKAVTLLHDEIEVFKKTRNEDSERSLLVAEVERLQNRVAELEAECIGLCEIADEAKVQSDQFAKDCHHWQARSAKLEARLKTNFATVNDTASTTPDATADSLPATYVELPAWTERNLAGRLVLLPRALRGMSGAQYHDVGKVAQALQVLATEYRNMRLGISTKGVFQRRLAALHLRCSLSINQQRAGLKGDAYFVNHPTGTDQRRFLDMHLRNHGNTRKPERCLAIYFLWDEENRLVVVGWLPGHLPIESSN